MAWTDITRIGGGRRGVHNAASRQAWLVFATIKGAKRHLTSQSKTTDTF